MRISWSFPLLVFGFLLQARESGARGSPLAADSSTGARATTGPLAGPLGAREFAEEPLRDRFRLNTPEEERLLASTTPAEIGAFELGHLASSAASLAPVGPWTPRGRLARAYRAGLFAFEVIEGARVVPEPTPHLELRNKWYICLQSRARPEGFEKPTEFSAAIARRAQAELGWSQQTPGMMRSYLERKVPLKDHRTLTLMGFYLAHMWEAARESGNIEFESWASRGLLMVEQWAIDNGRSQAAWLLSGLPDPDFAQLQARRTDLRPYGRLAEPTWIAAQVAYLRDVEFLENRLRGKAPGQGQGATQPEAEEAEENPTRPRRPRRAKALADKPAQ